MEKAITASLPEHLCGLLRPGKTGEVVLVTSAGIYLRFEEQILLLCDARWGTLPIGIGLEDFDHAVRLLRPQQGQTVTVLDDCLIIQGERINLVPQKIPCAMAPSGLPHIQYVRKAAEELAALRRERGISMLVLPLVLGQERNDQWAHNPYCSRACHDLDNLIDAFRHCDGEKIRIGAEKLLGLGQGLTPSADDVLLGMLYVLRALPQTHPEQTALFQKTIAQQCDARTNQISAAYLKAMIAGAPFERMDLVFHGMCARRELDIQKLVQIGSSSGSEMLLGMLIALRICGYDVS